MIYDISINKEFLFSICPIEGTESDFGPHGKVGNAEKYYEKARKFWENGEYAQAEKYLTTAFFNNPAYEGYLMVRGEIKEAQGKYLDALVDYYIAAKLEGGGYYPWSLFFKCRGKMHEASGEYDEALADYEYAKENDSQNSEIRLHIAKIHFLLGRNDKSSEEIQKAENYMFEPDNDPKEIRKKIDRLLSEIQAACIKIKKVK